METNDRITESNCGRIDRVDDDRGNRAATYDREITAAWITYDQSLLREVEP